MGMTMTQKILAAHAGLPSVSAGQLIEADLDLVLGNDITSPVAIHEIGKMNVEGVFHKDKIALVMDHFAPNKDIKSAEHCKCVREFACKNDIISLLDMYELVVHTRNNAVAEHGAVYHIVRICIACKSLCCLLQKQMAVCYPKDFLALIHSVPEQPMCCC